MKKISFLLIFILLLGLLVSATSAFASPAPGAAALAPKGTPGPGNDGQGGSEAGHQGSDNKDKGPKTTYKGTLDSISTESLTLELATAESLIFALTDQTKLKAPGGPKKTPALADLKAGIGLLVQAAQSAEGQFTALMIHIVPGKPAKAHHVGTVTAYAPGESITIEGKDGVTTTYLITADAKLLPAGYAGEIAVGKQVTIIAPRNVNPGETLTASGVVLHTEDEAEDGDDSTGALEATKAPKPTKEPKVTPTP